jgi:hypothetical protein
LNDPEAGIHEHFRMNAPQYAHPRTVTHIDAQRRSA